MTRDHRQTGRGARFAATAALFFLAATVGAPRAHSAVRAADTRLLWSARLGYPYGAEDLQVSPDGTRVYVPVLTEDYVVVSHDAGDGSPSWVGRYDGPANDNDRTHALAVSADGTRVFVTGQSDGPELDNDIATVAFNSATGEAIWAAPYEGPDNRDDIGWAVGVSPDGSRVFIAGVSETTNTTSGMLTAAYDAATGDELWSSRTDPSPGDQDIALTLAVSPAGDRLYVAGSRGPFIPSDLSVLAYDTADGSLVWEARYNGPGNYDDGAAVIKMSPDGDTVFVTGTSFGQDTYQDYVTIAYQASTGDLEWESRYDGPAGTYESANSLGISPDGATVYVTGSSEQSLFGFDDYATVAYDAATGGELWVTRFDAPVDSEDEANGLAVSPRGRRLYVTGESRFDYTTLAYRTDTGDQIWAERYGGPDQLFDSAYYVAVSPNGRAVYVTGTVQGDVVTLAYRS